MTKAELQKRADELELAYTQDATNAELEAMIAKAEGDDSKSEAPLGLQRRRINRGSTRRITNALSKFDKAAEEFTKEMDLQFFEADDKGERTGEWGFVKGLREMRTHITAEVNKQLYPEAPASGDE